MEFVKKFKPPDLQAENFTPSTSPNFNSFSKEKPQKMSENGKIYTAGKNFTYCRQWRHWQIPPLAITDHWSIQSIIFWSDCSGHRSHIFWRFIILVSTCHQLPFMVFFSFLQYNGSQLSWSPSSSCFHASTQRSSRRFVTTQCLWLWQLTKSLQTDFNCNSNSHSSIDTLSNEIQCLSS